MQAPAFDCPDRKRYRPKTHTKTFQLKFPYKKSQFRLQDEQNERSGERKRPESCTKTRKFCFSYAKTPSSANQHPFFTVSLAKRCDFANKLFKMKSPLAPEANFANRMPLRHNLEQINKESQAAEKGEGESREDKHGQILVKRASGMAPYPDQMPYI